MGLRSAQLGAVIVAGVVLLVSCHDEPQLPTAASEGPRYSLGGATLLECPSHQVRSLRRVVDPAGGSVSVDGHRITLPAGAVDRSVELTFTVPPSPVLAVRITADDAASFRFAAPVEVTLSYSRCSPDAVNLGTLSAWYVDSRTFELLEHMGGTIDHAAQTVTFTTNHLSMYALAD